MGIHNQPSETDAIIAKNIRRYRMGGRDYLHYVREGGEAGMTMEQMSVALERRGIHLMGAVISTIERGKRSLKISELIAIADVLGVSLDDLLEGIKLPKRKKTDDE